MPQERWLLAGLGNPESEYGGTRHNVGAELARLVARRYHRDLDRNKRIHCEATEVQVGEVPLAVVVPMTYMNLSGGPVQQACHWYSIPPERVIVAYDELDVPLGELRLKRGGGVAGHRGPTDVDRALGTRDSHRLRIGIGRPPGRQPPTAYVLRKFTDEQRGIIDVVLEHAADAVEHLVTQGLEPTQNRYHALTVS